MIHREDAKKAKDAKIIVLLLYFSVLFAVII